jgi:hypothetical protein
MGGEPAAVVVVVVVVGFVLYYWMDKNERGERGREGNGERVGDETSAAARARGFYRWS